MSTNLNYFFLKKKRLTPLTADVDVVYLNIEDNPLTTMTVQWHTVRKYHDVNSKLYFRKRNSDDEWTLAEGHSHDPPATNQNRLIHFCKITGLNANTGYEFYIDVDANKTLRYFRTMPNSLIERNIKIAFTSDSHGFQNGLGKTIQEGHYWWFEELTENIGAKGFDADILVGVGDYTYDEGRGRQFDTDIWVLLLKELEKYLVNTEGYMIPFLPAVGNHDVYDLEEYSANRIPEDMKHYASLFAFPTKDNPPFQKLCLGNLVFGDYFNLIILDTGTNQYGTGDTDQLEFLDTALESPATWVIPVYHRPMYSIRNGEPWVFITVKDMFQERFQNAGVKVEMHGHSHNYSRSELIEDHEVVEVGGILYCGAGNWCQQRQAGEEGMTEQQIEQHIEDMEYIASGKGSDYKAEDGKHFWGVILSETEMTLQSINYKGVVFYEKTMQ